MIAIVQAARQLLFKRAKEGTSVYNLCGFRSQKGNFRSSVVWLCDVGRRCGSCRPQRIRSSSDQEFCKLHFGGDMRVRFAVAAAVMSLALSVAAQKEMHMVHAKGSFDIKMTDRKSVV